MNAQTLPIPNPEDWVTIEGAARLLGRSKQQVIRYVADQRLAGYRVYGARDRLAERLLWRADVERFKEAQRTIARPGIVEQVRRRASSAAVHKATR